MPIRRAARPGRPAETSLFRSHDAKQRSTRDPRWLPARGRRAEAPDADVPPDGGEIVLDDGSMAVAEPLGRGEAYLVRRPGSRGAKTARVKSLKRAERRARELAAEQAALRQIATLVARESSPDHLFAVVAEQVARNFDVPHVRLTRYEPGRLRRGRRIQ